MNIFYNHRERRVRSGWRLTFQFILMEEIVFLGYMILPGLTSTIVGTTLVTGLAMILSVWLCTLYLDKRSILDLGLRVRGVWFLEYILGLLASAVAILFIFITEWSFGWLRVENYAWNLSQNNHFIWYLLGYLVLMMFVGFYEELMFRGYQLTNLLEGMTTERNDKRGAVIGAILISSALFGAAHMSNPHATWLSAFNIMSAGVMLAIPFFVTGRLGLSIGLHAGWNFVEGSILGFPVSGLTYDHTMVNITQHGPPAWTGGSFGPEGGMLGIIGIALIIVIELIYFGIAMNTDKERLMHDSPLHKITTQSNTT